MNLTALTTALSDTFTSDAIMGVVTPIITTGGPLFLLWFGARKLVKAVTGVFRSGKLRV